MLSKEIPCCLFHLTKIQSILCLPGVFSLKYAIPVILYNMVTIPLSPSIEPAVKPLSCPLHR